MAETDLETFKIYQSEASIAPYRRNEGTNASRFAIAGALTVPAPGSFNDRISLIDADTLELFGFIPDLAFTAVYEPVDSISEEARAFIERRDIWLNGEARAQAWSELSEGNLRARLMLLAAGVCSALERESTAAAVAILGVLRDSSSSDLVRHGPWNYYPAWWGRDRPREWPLMWFDDSQPPPTGRTDNSQKRADRRDGIRWRKFAEEIISQALERPSEQILLSVLAWIAVLKTRDAAQSQDSVVREFATSARWLRSNDTPGTFRTASAYQAAQPSTSTMVHGTWGWKGTWWYPGGDFHSYVAQRVRPNLYGGGMEFSWSGAYSQQQRITAGERFSRWVRGHDPVNGLGTVFAHSYGGEVAARAINSGARVHELVLLSAPVNAHHHAAVNQVSRIVDIRLKFDIVLWLARANQRMPPHPNVTKCVVDTAYWKHGATHAPEFWSKENIVARVGL